MMFLSKNMAIHALLFFSFLGNLSLYAERAFFNDDEIQSITQLNDGKIIYADKDQRLKKIVFDAKGYIVKDNDKAAARLSPYRDETIVKIVPHGPRGFVVFTEQGNIYQKVK